MCSSPVSIGSYPRAILHVDADAFFAAVEQSLEPSLQGKPVVTGRERGIIACANYAAKARGIKRGIRLFEARKLCPELVILPSDYETYSLFSRRMFEIMRRFTPDVEEYSIDEAFADITGMRRVFRGSYEDIALAIQAKIRQELGITVSVGLSCSKALAKLCSKFRKPAGFTAVPGRYIHLLLQRTPLEKVWGFGPSTVQLLGKFGLNSAYDFVQRPEAWVSRLLHKPGRELWSELRGRSVWNVTPEAKSAQATILKSATFTPPSTDRALVYAQMIRNAESAFAKARRHRLRARCLGVVLRRQDFGHDGLEAKLDKPVGTILEAIPLLRTLFDRVFTEGLEYRATLVALGRLENDGVEQFELFQDRAHIESLRRATRAMDAMNGRYGSHTVCLATGLDLLRKEASPRDEAPARRANSFKGETARKRLAIPRWNVRV
jgi:DNA polymerase-4/DNA polymerase V